VEQQTVGQRWGELVLNLIKQWDLRQPGLSSAMKKEGEALIDFDVIQVNQQTQPQVPGGNPGMLN
jgi:hypothetical protein